MLTFCSIERYVDSCEQAKTLKLSNSQYYIREARYFPVDYINHIT